MRSLKEVVNFQCPAHVRWCRSEVIEQQEETIEVDGKIIGEMKQLCYLRDIFYSKVGVERVVRERVTAAWTKW